MTEEEKKCELKDGDISDAVIDKIDEYFPKGKNKDRGKVLYLIAAMQYEKKQALTAQAKEHNEAMKAMLSKAMDLEQALAAQKAELSRQHKLCVKCFEQAFAAEKAEMFTLDEILGIIREKQKDRDLHPMFLTGLTWIGLTLRDMVKKRKKAI